MCQIGVYSFMVWNGIIWEVIPDLKNKYDCPTQWISQRSLFKREERGGLFVCLAFQMSFLHSVVLFSSKNIKPVIKYSEKCR